MATGTLKGLGSDVGRIFAQNGVGTIERTELIALLKRLDATVFTDQNTTTLLDCFDAEGSTSVSAEAFVKWICEDRPVKPRDPPNILPRHLVLHFDVNKTIVMMDSVTSKSMSDVANHVIASSAWGSVKLDSSARKSWICGVSEPTIARPCLELVSYVEFMEEQFPGKDGKPVRESYFHIFTNPGQPGEALRPHFDSFMAALRLPEGVAGTEAAKEAGLRGDAVFIIPAFFELLLHLKRIDASFCIVFRTFGKDLADVAVEFNAFCEGKHPLFPGAIFDGSDGAPDYRISFDDTLAFGTFFRSSNSGAEDAIVYGTLKQPKFPQGLDYYDAAKFPGIEVVSGGVAAIYRSMRARVSKPGTIALRDYFPWWRQQDFGKDKTKHNGGKLMVIEPYSATSLQSIFFDDNIAYDAARIVDVRHESLPAVRFSMEYLSVCHLVKAEPLQSVTDPGYFIKHVERLASGYDRRLELRNRMFSLIVNANKADLFCRIAPRGGARRAGQRKSSFFDPWSSRRNNNLMYSQKFQFPEDEDEFEDLISPKLPKKRWR